MLSWHGLACEACGDTTSTTSTYALRVFATSKCRAFGSDTTKTGARAREVMTSSLRLRGAERSPAIWNMAVAFFGSTLLVSRRGSRHPCMSPASGSAVFMAHSVGSAAAGEVPESAVPAADQAWRLRPRKPRRPTRSLKLSWNSLRRDGSGNLASS